MYNYLILVLLIVGREEKHGLPDTKPNKNIHAIRKQQRRHTIADQSSLPFIKPMGGLWKQTRRQSMFKNTLPTVSLSLLMSLPSISDGNNKLKLCHAY